MNDIINFSTDFDVDESMVNEFARLTGDYNAMHVDPEIARKSKYRRTVVHGMIPYSFLQLLQLAYPDQRVRFTDLSARFVSPVFAGDSLHLEISHQVSDGKGEFDATWFQQGSEKALIKSKGQFRLDDDGQGDIDEKSAIHNPSGKGTFIQDEIDENIYTISDLKDKQESFSIAIKPESAKAYCDNILNRGLHGNVSINDICNNLASVLNLSTMVGMRLPGRYAIFTRFIFSFADDVESDKDYLLEAAVSKVTTATETIEAKVKLGDEGVTGDGKIVVLLNPPPKKMISSEEIIAKYKHLGLDGKTVLITGASRGIGETAAKLFAALGANVVINYFRGKTDAENIVQEIKQNGGEALCVQCDITDNASVKNMVATAIEKYGRIDVLVNNAVRDFLPKDIINMEWEDYLEELDVSVKGLHACCKAVIPVFKENSGGKIVNLSTVAVDNPVAGQSRYITAKSAVAGYTKSLAKELMKYNIQANLVMPNMADTDLVSVLPSVYKDKIAESRPYGRHVYPVEVAQSIVFLASSWSDAITGQKIVINLGEPPFA